MTLADNHCSEIQLSRTIPFRDGAVSFFAAQYPLIRLFRFGPDVLLYDAKPHFAVCLTDDELDVLIDFLKRLPDDALAARHSSRFPGASLAALLAKFGELAEAGVFLAGPAEMISPVERDEIDDMLQYYDRNILLRKFCLEVTQDCNFRCSYCKKTVADGYKGHTRLDMTIDIARAGIDYYFRKYTQIYDKLDGDAKALILRTLPPSLSWYGGEPLLNFDLIRESAAYFRGLPWERHGIPAESIRFSCNTNLSIMNAAIIRFLIDNRVRLFASLDGPAEEHDRSRVFLNKRGTFKVAYRNLMALKDADADYFRTHVTILSVYTEDHDRAKCQAFVQTLDALSSNEYRAEHVGTFVPDAEAALARHQREADELFAAFQDKAQTEADSLEPHAGRFNALFPFATINFDRPSASNSLRRSLTCPMGQDNLMLSAGGDFVICHKVDDSMPIGRGETGVDLDRLAELHRRYNAAINNPECRNCWAVNFCSLCAATRMAGHGFINPSRQECDYIRARTFFDFLCFAYVAAELPDLWDRISAYRHNPDQYIGIIDADALRT